MTKHVDELTSAAADAIRAWNKAAVHAMRDGVPSNTGVFVAPLPPLMAGAGLGDFRASDWKLDDDRAPSRAVESGDWAARVSFSPNGAHQALLFAGDVTEWAGGAALWIDGEAVAVPRSADGSSLIDDLGEWLDDRFFAVQVGGLDNHPLATVALTSHGLGNVRGLWIYDAVQRRARTILPRDDQAWRGPVGALRNGRLRIYATPGDRQAGLVAWEGDPMEPAA